MRSARPPMGFHFSKRHGSRLLHLASETEPPQLKAKSRHVQWLQDGVPYSYSGARTPARLELVHSEPRESVPGRQAPNGRRKQPCFEWGKPSIDVAYVVDCFASTVAAPFRKPERRCDNRLERSHRRTS